MQIKETIILAPGANESEILKGLSKFGKNTFNVRVFDSLSLSEYLLNKSGFIVKEDFLNNTTAPSFVYREIKEIKYFARYKYDDAISLFSSINKLRKYFNSQDEEIDQINKLSLINFKEKNEAIIKIFNLYLDKIKGKYLDEVLYIRKAIKHCKTFTNFEFLTLKEFPLTPLEIDLINKVSNSNFKEESLGDSSNHKVNSYLRSFGTSNEVEYILNFIKENKIPFDQCLIATPETNLYPKLFLDYKNLISFNLTSGVNYPISECNCFKLFLLIEEWDDNIHHFKFLKPIFDCRFFNLEKFKKDISLPENFPINEKLDRFDKISFEKIIETVGNLKICFDKEYNESSYLEYFNFLNNELDNDKDNIKLQAEKIILEFVKKIIDIFNLGMINFLKEYNSFNDIPVEVNAHNKIIELLELENFDDVKNAIHDIKVGSETPKDGAIHITTFKKAKSILRPHVFIVGLSSNYFPQRSKEDPIILDEDYSNFGFDNMSNNVVLESISDFFSLVEIANNFKNNIYLSFSSYNSQTLKLQNASSVILNVYQDQFGKDKNLKSLFDEFEIENINKEGSIFHTTSFFKNNILDNSNIANAYINKENISISKDDSEFEINTSIDKDPFISATAFETFVNCPKRYYYKHILKCPDNYEDSIYDIFPPLDEGNLAHDLMSKLDKSQNDNKDDFMLKVKNAIDKYFITHKSLNLSLVNQKKKEFIEMMEYAFDKDNKLPILNCEKEIYFEHTFDNRTITIHGKPDKIFVSGDKALVVDYKTKNNIEHFSNDFESCCQILFYCYLLNNSTKLLKKDKSHWGIISAEYIYTKLKIDNPTLDEEKILKYFEEIKNNLNDLIISLKSGDFIKKPKKEKCKYCPYKEMCGN